MPHVNIISPGTPGNDIALAAQTSSTQDISSSQPQQQQTPHSATSPSSSLDILPSNQQGFQEGYPAPLPPVAFSSGRMAPPPPLGQDASNPGPHRHPRPLTAAELHSQLEQEQELIVNRLTRDLTMLQMARSHSVVSNASSTSASTSTIDPFHQNSFTDTHMLSGPGHPVPTTCRHHRTSSNASTPSFSLSGTPLTALSATIPMPQTHSGNPTSVLEAARHPRGASSMSRQNSTTSHRSDSRSRSSQSIFPALGVQTLMPDQAARDQTSLGTSVMATPGSDLSPGLMPATPRFEETALQRQELERLKRENASLRQRIKDLEKMVREQKGADVGGATRTRSDSTSTAASLSLSLSGPTGVGGALGGGTGIAGDRRDERRGPDRAASSMSITGSVGVGVPEEELKVGESAATLHSHLGPVKDGDPMETQ